MTRTFLICCFFIGLKLRVLIQVKLLLLLDTSTISNVVENDRWLVRLSSYGFAGRNRSIILSFSFSSPVKKNPKAFLFSRQLHTNGIQILIFQTFKALVGQPKKPDGKQIHRIGWRFREKSQHVLPFIVSSWSRYGNQLASYIAQNHLA